MYLYEGVALIINVVLLYFILQRTSKEIGNYQYLLFAFVLNDIFFTIIHAVSLPVSFNVWKIFFNQEQNLKIACTYGDAFVIFATGLWSSQV